MSRNGEPMPADSPPERLLWSIDQIAVATDLCRRTIERMIAAGTFPAADARIGRLVRWRDATVRQAIEQLCTLTN